MDEARRSVSVHHRDVPNVAGVCEGTSYPCRYLEQQFSEVRCESEYGRATERQPTLGDCVQYDLSRRAAPVAHCIAGNSRSESELKATLNWGDQVPPAQQTDHRTIDRVKLFAKLAPFALTAPTWHSGPEVGFKDSKPVSWYQW